MNFKDVIDWLEKNPLERMLIAENFGSAVEDATLSETDDSFDDLMMDSIENMKHYTIYRYNDPATWEGEPEPQRQNRLGDHFIAGVEGVI